MIAAKSAQRVVASRQDVGSAKPRSSAEFRNLGCDHDVVGACAGFQPTADNAFALATDVTFAPLAINVCGVNKVATEFAVEIQNIVALALVSTPAEDVAAEAEVRNLKIGFR